MNDNAYGIKLYHSDNSTIRENNVTNSYYGIHLVDSTNCLVTGNNVSKGNGGYSIVIYRAYDNTVYHNSFINHFIYAYGMSNNTWDNGLEGNYWSIISCILRENEALVKEKGMSAFGALMGLIMKNARSHVKTELVMA